MNIIEHAWRVENHEELSRVFSGHNQHFVSCDPDANGAIVVWQKGEPRLVLPIAFIGENLDTLAELCAGGVRVLAIVETQFMSANMMSTITMARRAGYVIGLLSFLAKSGAEVVSVVPSTWQYPIARTLGIKGALRNGMTKEVSRRAYEAWCERSVEGWHGFTAARKQGCMDALGIGNWWKMVTP